MSFPFKKTRWIKAKSSSFFYSGPDCTRRISPPLYKGPSAGFYILKEKTKAILTLFWMSCMTFGTVTPTTGPMRRDWKKKKKKKEDRRPLRRCRLMKNPTKEKGKKKKKRGELISDGIEAIITRLASVLALLILMSSLIRFNLTAPNWSTGIFSFSYFLYLSPPPPTTYGVTHIDFCAKRI